MRKKISQHLTFAAALFVLTLVILQQVRYQSSRPSPDGIYTDKVNLALRLTANLLLREEGDSTSMIPPVKNLGPNIFLLKLNRDFDYDSLPYFLDRALHKHGIDGAYDVAVLECESEELMLGYTADTRLKEDWAPCGGRLRDGRCFDLRFTAPMPVQNRLGGPGGYVIPLLICLILIGYIVLYLLNPSHRSQLAWGGDQEDNGNSIDPGQVANGNGLHRFGHFTFDPANQLLTNGRSRQELTYREAKLLRYLCTHSNQLLERDQILKAVWEDEGIVVGRSLDVFISRLRKKLNGDDSVRISSVHGVGYKMEVLQPADDSLDH